MNPEKTERLGMAPIPKLLFELALPSVIAQTINVLYNIIDRIYIGHMHGVGEKALTGVGVTFPIVMLVTAFSALIGMGGAPLASIRLGEKKQEKAEEILGNSVTALCVIAIVLTVFFECFKIPILYAFGASNATISYANDYITIYLLGTLFVQLSLGLNPFISAQGKAKVAMLSVLIGAVLNILLDPVLIFALHMGVKGAAYATIFSQLMSAIWVVCFLCSQKSQIRIQKKMLTGKWKVLAPIVALGVSPFVMQSTESLVTITLNRELQRYGNDLHVGSMTIIMSVLQLIVMPLQGITQGTQPMISYNYGAGNKKRVEQAFHLLLAVALCYTVCACLATFFFPRFFVQLFNQNPQLVQLTEKMLPVYFAGIWAFGAQAACQAVFLALGQAKISLFLALLRKVILLVPFAILFPIFWGVEGIYCSEPVADIVASAITLTVFLFTYRKILEKPIS